MNLTTGRGRDGERGQILVIFALMFIVATAMVGLVLDGGGTFAVRRDAQSAADLAALGGANDYLANSNAVSAVTTAQAIATANGYTDGVNGDTVKVTVNTTTILLVQVDITTTHHNAFARVIPGQDAWQVSVTATATSGVPDTATGPAPIQFSYRVFEADNMPQSQFTQAYCATATGRDVLGGCPFGETNGDVPTSASDIAWTTYGDPVNANSNDINKYITSVLPTKTLQIDLGANLSQHNMGNHTDVYGTVQSVMAGNDYPVPVVDDSGHFVGWATFHVTSAAGGSDKHVYGYFKSPVKNASLTITKCSGSSCPTYLGTYVIKLIN